jgi:hypothetical protein
MILENYEITCSKYVWPAGTDLDKVNIFSDLPPLSTETIDLKPFLIDMGEITWNLETTDEEDGKSNLYYEESDVTYELSGIVENGLLVEFFGLYRDTTTEKYLISVKEQRSGTFIHRGIVSQELIEMNYSPKADSEIIKVTAMGYLKEFKAYFSTKPMLHNDTELHWDRQQNLPNVIFNSKDPTHYTWGCSMQNLLNQSFAGGVIPINFILEEDVADWFIIKNPCLSKRLNYIGLKPDNTCWVKTSYERIKAVNENRFDFIRRLCNAMGWIFYYSDNNFYIKNRIPVEDPVVLDFDNVIEFTLSKLKETSDYSTVIILNGAVAVGLPIHVGGWGHTEGERMKIFSGLPNSPWERWWHNIPLDWNLYDSNIQTNSDFKLQKYYNQNDDSFTWCFVTRKTSFGIYSWEILEQNKYLVKKNETLFIDAGDSEGWTLDTGAGFRGKTFPNNFDYEIGAQEIRWKGNYGSSLFKIDSTNQVFTYEDYKETTEFNDNFQKFMVSDLSRRLKIKYKGIITNPIQKYNFINDANRFNGDWVTVNLKLNLNDETTSLELQLKQTN